MMKNRHIYWMVSIGVLLTVMSVFVGCDKKIVNNDSEAVVSVAIDIKAMTPGAASAVDSVLLVIEGSDFGSIIKTMERDGGTIYATVTVPAGRNRRFSARALQGTTILYQGDQTIDVVAGAPITLDLVLSPVVPMLNITPHYQSYQMGDSFYVDVNVFNVDSLAGISLNFAINFSPCYIGTAAMGEQYNPDSVGMNTIFGYDTVTVELFSRTEVDPIVDARGNAHLATVGLFSYNDWGPDTATVVMTISPNWLYSGGGSQFPLDSLYYDNAEVFLTRPPLAASHDATADDRAVK
jgi:hypothetical protein